MNPSDTPEKMNLKMVPDKDALVFMDKERIRLLSELELNSTELFRTKEKLTKISHLYAFISQVNQNITRIHDESVMYANACAMALSFGNFKMAWIGEYLKDERINLINQCGIPDEDVGLFTNAPYMPDGPMDTVLKTGEYHICNNIEEESSMKAWHDFALQNGIRSYMVMPLKKSGKVIATLNLYSGELNFAEKEEIALLVEVSGDISFALDLFEREKIHSETEALVVRNEKRFRTLTEKSRDMITFSTADGQMLYSSPSLSGFFGYTADEIISTPAMDFIHPDDLNGYLAIRKVLLEKPGEFVYSQMRLKHKNGKWIWCDCNVFNMLNEPDINAIVSNFHDISELKMVEEQIAFDKNNLNALINNTGDLMWSISRDYKLLTSNTQFDVMVDYMFGCSIQIGDYVLPDEIPKAQTERFRAYYERALKGEKFTEIEHVAYPAETWTEISFYPIFNGDEIIGTACHSHDITKSKMAERELCNSEAFSRGVLNSLSAHVAVIDGSGKILEVNEAWKNFSIDNGEQSLSRTGVGENYFDVCERSAANGNGIAALALKGMRDSITEDRKFSYLEYSCHSADERRWFGMRAMKFESNVPMLVISHQDITERMLAEEDVVKSEAHLKEAQRLAKLGSWNFDIKTDKLTWSEELYNVFDTDKHTFIETHGSFVHLIDKVDRDLVIQTSELAKETGEPFTVEYKITTAKGEKRVINERGYGEKDTEGKVIRLFGTAQDITLSKKAELVIRESKVRYEMAAKATNDVLWDWNIQTNAIYRSGNYFDQFGYQPSSEDVYDDSWVDNLHPDDREMALNSMMEHLNNPDSKVWECEYRFFKSDGVMIYIKDKGFIVRDESGKALRMVGAICDITEQKGVELELQELLDVTKEQNTRLQNFAYIVSHNIRSHSANILGLVDVFWSLRKAEELDTFFTMLKKSTDKMGETIENLNEIITIQTDTHMICKDVDLGSEVDHTCSAISSLIQQTRSEIINSIPQNTVVYAVPSYIESILLNLITNGIKYRSPLRNPVIMVSAEMTEPFTVISIADNGIGIDLKKNGDKLFGMYKTFHNNEDARGIGLFISKNQIEVMGGKIEVESTPGVGSIFKIYIKNAGKNKE